MNERKYKIGDVVFIRCRVANYDYLTNGTAFGAQNIKPVESPDLGDYVLETVCKSGTADKNTAVFWVQDHHLISVAEAKKLIRENA